MSKEIVNIKKPHVMLAERCGVDADKVYEILKASAFKSSGNHPPSNEEVAILIAVCNQYTLNPFLREIYAYPDPKRGIIPIIGIDGWVSLAVKTGRYDGCDCVEIYDKQGKLEAVRATVYVKGMEHPVMVTEWFRECYRDTVPWKTMPRRMLRHKAFMQACRYAFGLSGIFDQDEGEDAVRNNSIEVIEQEGSRVELITRKACAKAPASRVEERIDNTPPPAAPEPPAPHQEDSRAVPEATAEQVETQSEAVTPEQSNQIQVLGLNLIDRVEPGKEECTSGIVSGSKIYKTSNGKEYLAFYVYDPECEVGQDSKVRFTFWDINDQDAMASIVDMSRVEISFTRTVKNNKVYYNALSVRPAPCSTPF